MSDAVIEVRPIQPCDIGEVLAVQRACYRDELIEPAEAFLAKSDLCPAACVGAWEDGRLLGYLFAHPWASGQPVQLDSRSTSPPARPDVMYLHDLAVSPAARGLGVPKQLIAAVSEAARQAGTRDFALVAVQGSEPFWERWGFVVRYVIPEYAPGVPGSYMTREGVPEWR